MRTSLPPRRSVIARRPRPYRPQLEALEGRWVPTTVINLLDSGPGSLRQALLDTPADGTVNFLPGLTGTIILTTGQLPIAQDLTIAGPGASVLTVSSNQTSRVFDIAPSTNVGISGLTIADGLESDMGGGILNAGTLTLTACTLSGNAASYSGGSSALAEGGGVFNSGTLNVTRCILSGNSASADALFAGQAFGGGIYNGSSGPLTVDSSTFNVNSANGSGLVGHTPIGSGGGIYNAGMLTVTASTLSGNSTSATDLPGDSGQASGGGIYNAGPGTLILPWYDSCSLRSWYNFHWFAAGVYHACRSA